MYELPQELTNELKRKEFIESKEISKFQESHWNTWIWWLVPSHSSKTLILTFFGKKMAKDQL